MCGAGGCSPSLALGVNLMPVASLFHTEAQACGSHVNPPQQQQGWLAGARICKTRTPSRSLTASQLLLEMEGGPGRRAGLG